MNLQRMAMLLIALVMGLTADPGAGASGAQPADVIGTWEGRLALDANTRLAIQFLITRKPDGGYAVVLNSPDNPALKNVAATGVSFDGGTLKLQVPSLSGSYAATMKDGKLDGQWTQPGSTLPLVLAPYQLPALSKEAMSALKGAWNGKLKGPAGNEVTLVTRFKSGAKGELVATLAQIEGGGQEIPLSDVTFADGKLSFRVPRVNAAFNGTVTSGAIAGILKIPGAGQPTEGSPLTLKRGDVALPTYPLKLTPEAFAKLSGKWQGKLGQLTIIMRFDTNRDGQYEGFMDSPDQGAKGIPVTEVSFAGGTLKAQVGRLGQFEGVLKGKSFEGTWTQGGKSTPLTLTQS